MSKQEKIREGMRSHLNRLYTRCFGKEPEGIALDYIEHCLKNQEWWQASQGVVIKAERELLGCPCECCKHEDAKADDDFCFVREECGEDYKKWELAGYVATIPLIEE